MTTLREFEKEIREREKLLKNILLHKRDFEFLNTPGTPELIRFLAKHPLFGRSKDAIFKLLCIEVHKLFSDLKCDKFKLTQLLEKIKENRKKAEWSDCLQKHDIEHVEKLITRGLRNEAIAGLRRYRNKYLAHTDIEKTDATFFLSHFYTLIETALEVIDFLRKKVLKEEFNLELYIPADGFEEFRSLATTNTQSGSLVVPKASDANT